MPPEPYPLLPFQYEIVFRLMCERLTAQELAWSFPRLVEHHANPTLAMTNRLRPLLRRGWIEKLPDDPASLIYRATDRAREAVSW